MTALKRAQLTEGPVLLTLIRMTWSMFWGILAITSFQVADAYFVGRLGTDILASISFTFPVAMVLLNLSVGMGIGVTSVLSRSLGLGEDDYAHRLTTYVLLGSLVIGGLLMIVGLLSIDPLFRMLGAQDHHLPHIKDYMAIWYMGLPALLVTVVANFTMRSFGETRFPALLMIGSSVMNIALDPLLIYGWGSIPAMGMQGAALASIGADIVFLLLSLYLMKRSMHLLTMKGLSFQEFKTSFVRCSKVGIPASFANMIIPFSLGLVMAMVASYGEAAVAAFGVVTRVEMFSLIFPMALSSVMGPFVGQNSGAQKYDRIHEALRFVFRFCLIWGALLAGILALSGTWIMSQFDADPAVIAIGKLYFWIVPISYAGYSIVMNVSATFNAVGRPNPTLVLSIVRMFILYLPLAICLQYLWGIMGIFVAAMLANMISGVIAYIWNRRSCSVINGHSSHDVY